MDKGFAKSFAQVFVQQIIEFEGKLPDDMQVGVAIGGNVISADFVDFLPVVGLIVLEGHSKTAVPPLSLGVLVRAFLLPELPYPLLLAVPKAATEKRGRIQIGFQAQESPQA